MSQQTWYVYILTNHTNTVLYTGITNNLERRITEHRKGLSKHSFSYRYKLYKLVWIQEFPSPEEAIISEKKIKGWKRKKKIQLIESINPQWEDLSLM